MVNPGISIPVDFLPVTDLIRPVRHRHILDTTCKKPTKRHEANLQHSGSMSSHPSLWLICLFVIQ